VAAARQRQQQVQEQGQTATQGVNIEGDDVAGSTAKALSVGVVMPQLANSGDIAASGCPDTSTTKGAWGVAWGLASKSDAIANNDHCTIRLLEAQAKADCQHGEAQALRIRLASKLLGGFEHAGAARDMTTDECIKTRLDAAVTTRSYDQRQYTTITYESPPVVEDKPAEPVVPATPPAKPRKPAPVKSISTKPPAKPAAPGTTLNCGDDGVPQCVAKPRKPLALSGGQEGRS
jgi:hypothetical protein